MYAHYFALGQSAYETGLEMIANPYRGMGIEGQAWRDGFKAERRSSRK